jgi:hypothetical protein
VATRKKAQKSAARKKKAAAKPKKKAAAKPKKKAAAKPKKKAARAKKTARTARTKKKGARRKTGRAPSAKKAAKGRAKKVKKAKKAKKAIRRPRKKKPLKRVAVGDVVTVPTENRGEGDVGSWAATGPAEAILGLVCSIRAIATGKLVSKTRGDLSGYLLEVIHGESFLSQGVSSVNRGGPRRLRQLRQTPAWSETRALLRGLAGKQDLVSASSGRLSQDPFGSLLDGWQVMKVKADAVEAPE